MRPVRSVVRWLVAGYGRVGRCHVAAIRQTPGARLAGIVTLDDTDLPDVPGFDVLADAIDAVQPDAVIVAAPHDSHRELAIEAIEAGIPVLCEKPVGRSANEAADILAAAEPRGVPVGVVLNQRVCRHPRWVRALLEDGVFRCRSVSIQGALPALGGWNVDPGRSGGGLLRTVGIHYLDLLRFWFGEAERVAGMLAGEPVDDLAQLVLRYPGVQATVDLTAMAPRAGGPVSIRLQSGDGHIRLSGHGVDDFAGVPPPPEREPPPDGLTYGPGHLSIIRESTQGLLDGRGFPLPLDEHIPLLRLLDSIYAEAAANRPFVFEPSHPGAEDAAWCPESVIR